MSISAVMIDQREPEWVKQLTFGGAATSVTLLDEGDLLVACDDGNLLCIERKTPDDLLASIQDGRLLDQAARLTRQSVWAYLIVTGELQRSHDGKVITPRGATGWSWGSVQGALLTVQELGAFVIHAGNDQEYEKVVLSLAKRNRERVPLWPARTEKWLSHGEQVIASLPGIGMERLEAVLHAYQTPAQALCYLTDSNLNGHVPGIGTQTRKAIRQALKLPEGESLMVVSDTPQLTQEGTHVSASV
jgi:ERCC4-type nuclease